MSGDDDEAETWWLDDSCGAVKEGVCASVSVEGGCIDLIRMIDNRNACSITSLFMLY